MGLKERVYSVLVVSAAEKLTEALCSLLPAGSYSPVRTESSGGGARRALAERAWDFVIVNAPLPDEAGTRLAVDAGHTGETVVLLLVRGEHHPETHSKMAEHGVFTLPRPTSRQILFAALSWMSTARERLRKTQTKALSLEEKMEEIRLVNRAKWLLIGKDGMDEPSAHRLIEKRAMDLCVTRREIAEEVIRKYS